MAFTDLNITITEITITDFIPDFVTVLNSNASKFKTEFEKLINNLQIDTTNKKIGVDDPITSIRTIRSEVLADNVVNDGWYLTETSGSSTISIAHIKRAEILPSIFGSELNVDKAVIEQVLDATGAAATFKELTINETLNVTDKATFNGPVENKSGDIESVDTALTVEMELVSGEAVGTIDLTKATQKNLLLDLEIDAASFAASTWIATGLKLILNYATVDPSVHGQVFNIMIKSIKDSTSTPITVVLPASGLVVEPGVNNNDGGAVITLSDGSTSLELYAAGVDLTDKAFVSNLDIIQLTVDANYVIHVKNLKIA